MRGKQLLHVTTKTRTTREEARQGGRVSSGRGAERRHYTRARQAIAGRQMIGDQPPVDDRAYHPCVISWPDAAVAALGMARGLRLEFVPEGV